MEEGEPGVGEGEFVDELEENGDGRFEIGQKSLAGELQVVDHCRRS